VYILKSDWLILDIIKCECLCVEPVQRLSSLSTMSNKTKMGLHKVTPLSIDSYEDDIMSNHQLQNKLYLDGFLTIQF
jgi:hypothetical protein